MKKKKYIPNFSTLSTFLDRLSIENVKLAHFENSIEYDNLDERNVVLFKEKIKVQKEIINELKKETSNFMKKIFTKMEYNYVEEKRTFE